MTVSSSPALSADFLALETAALGQYQSQQGSASFAQSMQEAGVGTDVTADGRRLTGTERATSLIAVGTMGSDGKMSSFSAQQIASEYQAVEAAGQTAYGDALQSFLTLSQQTEPNGTPAASSYESQASFVGDNGLVAANFDTSFSLKPVAGSAQNAAG